MEYMDCDFECDNMHKNEILDFVSFTKMPETFASDYLRSNDWNLQIAVNNFFESGISSNESKSFTVISWNIDGLDDRHIDIRTNAFLSIINENEPDFVFLQEIINYSETVIRSVLANQYDFYIDSQWESYYCGILIKKRSQIKTISGLNITPFKGSRMGRKLLWVMVNIFGIDIKLMTSHLESTKQGSEERKIQLSMAFAEMLDGGAPCSIFAGDMNVRDFELRQLNSPPNPIVDVCDLLCSDSKDMATWEPKENKNISTDLSAVPGLRFDRMYFYTSLANSDLKPVTFQLLGKNLLTQFDMHTSDHWAISACFSL